MERIFLDWHQPCLTAAAAYLFDRAGDADAVDLSRTTVVLPGGRASRRLLEILVDLAEQRDRVMLPPNIIQPGRLDEVLIAPARPVAAPLARRLAWAAALAALDESTRRHVMPEPPLRDDLIGWSALADLMDRLHTELAGEQLSFDDVAERGAQLPDFNETDRWRAMAAVQRDYLARLTDVGLTDPQQDRADALQSRTIRAAGDIVIIAAADLNTAQRALLEQVADHVTVLVHAPAELADRFDAMGCLDVPAWCDAPVGVGDDRIELTDQPADQAAAVTRSIAAFDGRYRAEQITIGVPDRRLAPLIEQHLTDAGVPSRYAEGRPVAGTGPVRLLLAVAEYLDRSRFRDFAALLRHPDFELALRDAIPDDPAEALESTVHEWLTLLDTYYSDHLQSRIAGRWLGDADQRQRLRRVHDAAHELIGDLTADPQPIRQWAEPIRDLLVSVYGSRELAGDHPDQRIIIDACDHIRAQLVELLELDERLDGPVRTSAADALRLIVRSVADGSIRPEPTEVAVELLGWLELQLDDAPAVIVTSFNDGLVPAALNADPFLPNALRRCLGLLDNDRRYARDAYALSAILASRRDVRLIVGRRSSEGDPLTPSRLLFAGDEKMIAGRVKRLIADDPPQRTRSLPARWHPAERTQLGPPPPPPVDQIDLPRTMAVTAFRTYLACPYRFYLQHVLHLSVIDDTADELTPGSFGTVAHHVLNTFGRSDLAASTDVAPIRRFLNEQLDDLALKRFGVDPLPAVRVQIAQLRRRLDAFAEWQAERAATGWRIEHTEWGVSGEGVAFDVDGEPMLLRGRIDRIDVHESDGRRAVIDYKTSENPAAPNNAHRRGDGTWTDLQLPLYRVLLRLCGISGDMDLGYVVLPRDVKKVDGEWADWSEQDLAEAEDTVIDVVRRIRAGEFWPPADLDERFDDFAAICGAGQLTAARRDEEDSDD